MDLKEWKCLMEAFITSHFNYCSLIWMLHSIKLNNRMNQLRERALRRLYKDKKRTYDEP